jgi:hypothetical protein
MGFSKRKAKCLTLAMNEWGFIRQESFVALGKLATMCKFINCCGCVRMASLVVFKPHSS